ncbi:MAG: hypothetical protein GY749_30850 [Desulfobacteraceae bacterium]|nr:hypothetical protein [Desulfobacteraceae bacterium]
MMNKKYLALALFLAVLIGFTGCVPKKQVVYVPPPEPLKPKPEPKPAPPPQPSLEEQLDDIYKSDYEKWRQKMEQLITSEKTGLPTRHLLFAVQEFNDERTRDLCIDASFMYMRNKIQENERLEGNDQKLFSEFVEYALKSPEPHAMNRVKSLCRFINDEICRELR